jgi:hypothetical protein
MSPSIISNPKVNIPHHGMAIPNNFSSYTNQPIFAYPIREKNELSNFERNEKGVPSSTR